jgi:hypothetical protein
MFVCYVDEAGCTGVLPSATSPIQPLFCIAGLAVNLNNLVALTGEFISLKEKYFRNKLPTARPRLEYLLAEIKGGDVRTTFRRCGRNARRHRLLFLGEILDLVDHHGGRLFGKVFIKGIGAPQYGTAIYTSSLQKICTDYQHLLGTHSDDGIVVLDSRDKPHNERTSFSVFTQKFRAAGDPFPNIRDVPVFGHSNNHAGLQIADLVVSALLYPIAAFAYCSGHIQNMHVNPRYAVLRQWFGPRLQSLQYRYQDAGTGYWWGGFSVSDPLGHESTPHLFS